MITDTAGTGWTGGHNAVGDIAPALAHYTDKVLFTMSGSARNSPSGTEAC